MRSSRIRPSPLALDARRGDDPALAPAALAGNDVHHLAEDRLRDPSLLTGAVAFGAGLRLGPGLPAGTLAARAGHERREGDLLRHAEDRVGELDRQVVAQVGPGDDARPSPRAGG